MDDRHAVLIIDDDPTLLKTVSGILKNEYAASCAKSGREALELLAADYMPDIILLDIDMPDMNGFDTLKAIRAIEDARDIPVVFLTGAGQPASELKGLSSGGVDYITKPFIKEILLARLKVHLENGKKLRQLSMMEKNTRAHMIDGAKFERIAAGMNDTEKKVLRLIALGYTNHEIAEALSYSYNYIKKVANTIYEKKYVKKRGELKKMLI